MNHPNLVLTITNGLSASQVKPFVRTYQKCMGAARLVVFVGKIDQPTRDLLLNAGAELVPFHYFSVRMRHLECLFWPLWKWTFRQMRHESQKRSLARRVFNLFFLRSLLYLEYIEKLTEKPNWIFATDCRDVVFQGDLFADFREAGLYCFLEGKGRTIAACPSNSRMLVHCFGGATLKELGSREPSCAGTVLGDYANMLAYLRSMTDTAMRIQNMRMVPGDDQGLHNYLVQKNLVPSVRLVDNDTGPIGTMGCVNFSDVRLSEKSQVLQLDGKPYPVLHQHDRHPLLAKLYQL